MLIPHYYNYQALVKVLPVTVTVTVFLKSQTFTAANAVLTRCLMVNVVNKSVVEIRQ